MSVRRARALFVAGLLAVAATPLLARSGAPRHATGCAYDGVPVESGAPVVLEGAEGARRFCCVACAERFLEKRGVPASRAWVTDSASGRAVLAADATFVRSAVPSNPATGDRVHAFSSREDAERHAETHHGVLLEGDDRPLRGASYDEPTP
jgi:hypothetical protein